MLLLHCLSFKHHTWEWSIFQIIKLKGEWLTNYQEVRKKQPCHNFSDSSSTHENKLCMLFTYICVAGHFPNASWRTLNRKLMPQGKHSFFPSSLTKTSTDLLWLDWLPAVCSCLFHFTLEEGKIHYLFQFRACWKWLKCINKKASFMRALKYRIQCFINSQNPKGNDWFSCLLMKVNSYHIKSIKFGLHSMCSSSQMKKPLSI